MFSVLQVLILYEISRYRPPRSSCVVVVAPGLVLEPSNVGKLHLTTPALAELIGARHREVETRGP